MAPPRFVLCTALAISVAAAVGSQNLLPNPSFDSSATGWILYDNSLMLVKHRADIGSTLAAGSGPGALEIRLSLWNGSWLGTTPASNVPVLPNTTYSLAASSFMPSSHNSATKTVLQVFLFDASDTIVGQGQAQGTNPPDTWLRLSSTVSTPADATSAQVWVGVLSCTSDTETDPAVAVFDDVYFGASTGEQTASQELFVPAAAAAHGQAGTYWSTNGWCSNLTDTTLSISGALLRQGQGNATAVASPTSLGTIPPGGFVQLTDLVSMLGGSETTGGLYLLAAASGHNLPTDLMEVTTHTYTPNPYGDGVYGQGILALPACPYARAIVPGVFQHSQLRTNVGALNTSGGPITLTVRILNAAGNEEASATWSLQPYEQRQVSLPSLGLTSLSGGTVVFVLQGSGSFRGYTSTVDQHSGDAVFNEAR